MLWILVFASGFAGLVYEVLWLKQLALLFGSTSQAAGAVLAAFFGGMAAGSWFWGRRADRSSNPLRSYAGLEVGIAGTALFYFAILRLFHAVYPWFYQGIASDAGLLVVKFVLALLLVFPPAFFMGGTIPVIAQYLVRRPSAFGATAARLYGVNTLGAALGAFLAGFHLPLQLGFRGTCLLAIAVSTLVALAAFLLSRRAGPGFQVSGVGEEPASHRKRGALHAKAAIRDAETDAPRNPAPGTRTSAWERWAILCVCFLSGFGVLALEVLWMRMFSQVLENSVYTFSAILVIVLLCLAAGALVSSWLARRVRSPFFVLGVLLLLGGVAAAVTPFVFMRLTNGLQIVASKGSWSAYVLLIFRKGFLAIGLPALLLGMVFPFLLKTEERYAVSAGRSLGRLAAVNTAGAILGSLGCGFLFLEFFGMWATMQGLATLYLAAALLLPFTRGAGGIAVRIAAAVPFTVLVPRVVAFALIAAWPLPIGKELATVPLLVGLTPLRVDLARLPVMSVDPMGRSEEVLETWEGSDCTVAATRGRQGLSIKINSHYGLGSTGAFAQEQLQADIPLLVYPGTRSIFFLGMGTGITAGSALDPAFSNVTRVVACELVPEVVTAARKYITDFEGRDYTGGLFEDPRAKVLVEDGRHHLMATRERYDMVNADLFVPYRSGAGSLYSREHFQAVKDRLEPGGVFFQWLPLYQVTETEFSIVCRTMLEVFDQVTLWRNNFQPGDEVVALAGHKQAAPLPGTRLDSRAAKLEAVEGKGPRDVGRLLLPFNAQTILFFYCGNLTAARDLFDAYPVNTDDRPYIEYLAPRTYRNLTDTAVPWFVGPRIARLVDAVQRRCPPASDSMLANRSAEDRLLPVAGAAYHWARLWEVIGDEAELRRAWGTFVDAWTGETP